ncbi:MAG: hypothetical protein HYZ81_25550 [Nitrospinae bacterium]|nr:hypothetical protein [Nitrospinota bacterium]
MAPVTWREGYQTLLQASLQSPLLTGIEPLILEAPVLKLRVHVGAYGFVEVFWNVETGKTSFALIRGERRVFGADNTRGWHLHPFDDPDRHVPCDAMSLESFLQQVDTHQAGGDQPQLPDPA